MDHESLQRPAGMTPAGDSNSPGAEEAAPTLKEWLLGHSISVTLLGGLVLLGIYHLLKGTITFSTLLGYAEVGVGLGLVVFFHELGHFLVAKWCDVHVQTFSIGFGPAIPGCSFQWGETTYKLAIFPLGGYVKMVGQVDGDESDDPEADADPRSYRNKTVWQRMAIISAGVLMNVVLACVCFVVVYTHGVERPPAAAGMVVTGGHAWEKGITSGCYFTEIGDGKAPREPSFMDLKRSVVRSRAGERIRMVYHQPPDPKRVEIFLEPRVAKGDPLPTVGLLAPDTVVFRPRNQVTARKRPVYLNSPAAAARKAFDLRPGDRFTATSDPANPSQLKPLPDGEQAYLLELYQRWMHLAGQPMTVQVRRRDAQPGDSPVEIRTEPAEFQFNDVIVATTDPAQSGQVTPLPPDVHNPGSGLGDQFALQRRLQLLAGQFMTVRVRRTSGEEVELIVPPAYHYTLGVRMNMGEIAGIREGSPAEQAGVSKGNILQEVVLRDGKEVRRFVVAHKKDEEAKDLERFVDPLRLPYELRKWTEGRQHVNVTLIVFRGDPQTREERGKPYSLPEVEWLSSDRWRFTREVPLSETCPLPIPELGLAYHVETTVEQVSAGMDGPSGLQQDDTVKEVRFRHATKDGGKSELGKWDELERDQWVWAFWMLQNAEDHILSLKVMGTKKPAPGGARKGGEAEVREIELEAQPDVTWPRDDRGFLLKPESRILKAEHVWEAVLLGLQDTRDQIGDVFYQIGGMFSGRISPKAVGGPLTIAVVAYRFAQLDFWEFLFFLGMISVNLAVINFLPVPVLDGGHMVFLTYEKLRGRPASEHVRVTATYVGLLLILSLMVFVFYLDIKRIWF